MPPKALTAAVFVLAALAGCEDPVSDMGLQRKYQTYQPAETAQFADGKSARPIPDGAVPRPPDQTPGVPYAQLHADATADDPLDLSTPNPLAIDRETIEAGQLHFGICCAVCHGRLGNGDGMIVRRGFTRPPSFHVDRLRAAPDAHIYNVITRGYGAMFSYADRVPPTARWQIATYIRALQAASAAAPEDARRALIAQGDRPTTAPTTRPSTMRPATRP
jgi:mono/diheme cytochrome c family protein